MAKYKAVIADMLFKDVEVEQEILAEADAVIIQGNCRTETELIALAGDADALITFSFKPVSDFLMKNMPKCLIIVRGGIGLDTVDLPSATRNGLMVTNIPAYCVEEVSNLTMALMLALVHKIPVAMHATSRGKWDYHVIKPIRSLRMLTVGIIGFGHIGRLSGQKAASFDMKVQFCDPAVQGDQPMGNGVLARKVELDTLLTASDVIILHAPANEHTRHIINAETIAKMKKGCILINTARGQLLDTRALVDGLKNGHIGGAGLALIEGVPPLGKEHPLLAFENVIITPYYAWYSEDSVRLLRSTANCLIKNLSEMLSLPH